MLAERCLDAGFDADRFIGEFVDITAETAPTVIIQRKAHDRCFEVTDEMAEAVQAHRSASRAQAWAEAALALQRVGIAEPQQRLRQ